MTSAFTLLRPFIHSLPPETAHRAGLWALRRGMVPVLPQMVAAALEVKLLGLSFPNPVGLAAGFDKNAVAIDALLGQGFGFVEAGTVTPRSQAGNPKPRIFRLPEDEAVINRLGFNNGGLENFMQHFRARNKALGIAGANIGKNKDASSAIADYVAGMQAVYPYADYVTVNISSPNTPGLRDLQHKEALAQLLRVLRHTREECAQLHGHKLPVILKVAPDLQAEDIKNITEAVMAYGIDALMVSNTTISRPAMLKAAQAQQEGGLSGRPLFALSTETLRQFYRLTEGKLPLIGVGGIASAADAYAKIRAGASLVQLYTALVYQGFEVVRDIRVGLIELLKKDGFTQVQQAVGADA